MRRSPELPRVYGLMFAVLALTVVAPTPARALEKSEEKCASKLGKSMIKLASTYLKETASCRDEDISGEEIGACDPNTNSKIDKATEKLAKSAGKECGSFCDTSLDVPCLADTLCPPKGVTTEKCDGDPKDPSATAPFDMGNIGFPGPFCEDAIGGPVLVAADIADCTDTQARDTAQALIDAVYGSINNASGIPLAAQECLADISGAARKAALKITKNVAKCRNKINAGKLLVNSLACETDDAKTAKGVAKTDARLRSDIEGSCTTPDILELDLCGNGVAGTANVSEAQDCLSDAVREIANASAVPVDRVYTVRSLIEAAYPPPPVCGDDVVNQIPNFDLLLGEECDGADDAACSGACLPPGDLFECTCGDIPRMRFFIDSIGSETDAGWTGASHDQYSAQDSGFITSIENCNCTELTGATCTGSTSDPDCDIGGYQLPVCSWDPTGSRCDDIGNTNGADENVDCFICDDFSANPGVSCFSENDCDSQCYDGDGFVTGPCSDQDDCAPGEICRGRCDKTQTCIKTHHGGALPVFEEGTGVCNVLTYRVDVTGTRNIVTGDHEIFYSQFNSIHTGEGATRPCPVCGGFCEGGSRDLELCKGRCDTSGDRCRFDSDCSGGETCLGDSPDCPGGKCQLSLVCGADESQNPGVAGNRCQIEYAHPLFGTMSNDCLPSSGGIAGEGLQTLYAPQTNLGLSITASEPCTAAGFGLFDCHCEDTGGAKTAPNKCDVVCDAAGPQFGLGCATGTFPSGFFTTCDAASLGNAGKACDDDAKCAPGTCSVNPLHCEGDPAFDRNSCSTNAECGTGECVDACSGGRCVPLCIPDVSNPLDGVCASGDTTYHCDGFGFEFQECPMLTGSTCDATCSEANTPCSAESDCPPGESCDGPCVNHRGCEAGPDGVLGSADDRIGAGECVAGPTDCFLPTIDAPGGGDATNVLTYGLFCFPPTINSGINDAAGFAGPGRVLLSGVNVTNVTSIP